LRSTIVRLAEELDVAVVEVLPVAHRGTLLAASRNASIAVS
jgi:hypothetical protein